ncbi:hypothetical protein BJV74DRAFT_799812 [Russula compacta]|nr:hypothetical protein BJV74DRAFT_799812 [Russula compacta]
MPIRFVYRGKDTWIMAMTSGNQIQLEVFPQGVSPAVTAGATLAAPWATRQETHHATKPGERVAMKNIIENDSWVTASGMGSFFSGMSTNKKIRGVGGVLQEAFLWIVHPHAVVVEQIHLTTITCEEDHLLMHQVANQ